MAGQVGEIPLSGWRRRLQAPPWQPVAWLAALLLVYLVPFLLTLAVITPPWQNADEPFHMLRAVNVAHGGLIGRRVPGESAGFGLAGGDSDGAVYDANHPVWPVAMHPERRISLAALAASGAVRWGHVSFTVFQNTIQYGPVFYLPGAAAYWIGRAAGLSVNHTLLLARTFNALLFAAVSTAALCIARRARLPLAAILAMPPSLSLAASASQDSPLLACTALVVALLDQAIFAQRATTRNESVLLAVLLACIGMARPPYAGFLLVLFLMARPPTRTSWRLPAAVASGVLAWCVAVAWHVSVRLNGADAGLQLALLAANPMHIFPVIANTVQAFGVNYAEQFVGVFGWIDTRLPGAYMVGAAFVLVLAALAGTDGPVRRPWWPLGAALFATVSIFVLQYLTWSRPGGIAVDGVLGRYFLPMAMILALALPRLPIRVGKLAGLAVGLQAMVTPAVMLHAIVLRYYVGP
jgi:hypothetical protein